MNLIVAHGQTAVVGLTEHDSAGGVDRHDLAVVAGAEVSPEQRHATEGLRTHITPPVLRQSSCGRHRWAHGGTWSDLGKVGQCDPRRYLPLGQVYSVVGASADGRD